jgi:hypothetical protein
MAAFDTARESNIAGKSLELQVREILGVNVAYIKEAM